MRASLGRATEHLVSVHVDGPDGRRVLEYRSPDPLWQQPPPNLDFAAVALAHHAATRGTDLVLEGQATREQLERLDEYLMIWSVWRPDLFSRITISAEDEVDASALPSDRTGAVMGFSGGVDASFSLAAHKTAAVGRLTRDIGLGILIAGWDLKHGDAEALRRARDSAARALEAYGVRLAVVSTNWQQDFCSTWFMSFNSAVMAIMHTFSATHAAAVFANDRSYLEETRVGPYGSHMATNHLLGHPGFAAVSTGGTHTRSERVAFLRDHPALVQHLRVCWQPGAAGTNCGHCEKCIRTQLELRAAGISAAAAFPSPMRVEEIRSIKAHHRLVLLHFHDVLNRLDPQDEAHAVLRDWLQRQEAEADPRTRRLRGRIARLQEELTAARAAADAAHDEVAALRASTSWRVTEPLRRAAESARRLG